MSEYIQKAITRVKGAVSATPAAAKVVFRAATVSTEDGFSTESAVRGFTVRLAPAPSACGTRGA